MNRTSRAHWLLAACCLSFAALPAPAQVDRGRGPVAQVGGDAAKGVQRASCVLQLDVEPNRSGGRTMDTQTLNALLTSTALIDPAAQKALGLGPEAWPKVAQVELVPAGNLAVRLGVTISQNPDVKLPANPAQAFLDELAVRAKAAVEQAGARQEQAHAERMVVLEKEQAVARERLEKVQVQLRDLRPSEFDNDYRTTARSMAAERQQLEVTVAAARARLGVLQEEIQRLSAAAASRPANSPWAEVVTAREQLVEHLQGQVKAGAKPVAELLSAVAELAEARAIAATAGARPGDVPGAPYRGGFDPAERWQTESVNLRANIAESEVRLAAVNERMKAAGSATRPAPSPQEQDRLRQDEIMARQALSDVTNQLEQVRRERRSAASARLLILDGRSRP